MSELCIKMPFAYSPAHSPDIEAMSFTIFSAFIHSAEAYVLSKNIDPQDNHANQLNPNKGNDGNNRQHDQAQGNRGKQLNPNQDKGGKK